MRCLWRSSPAPADGPKRIVPDGCVDLVVSVDDVFVAGPDTLPWYSSLAAASALSGIRFQPGHAPRVLGIAADELRDQRVPLAELWGRRGRTATGLLLDRPQALPDVVAAELAGSVADPVVDALVRVLEEGASRVGVALADPGVGERQLRRRFRAAVGYGPATFLRVARLQRAAGLAGRFGDLASLAAEAGYADQAHLSRDCRSLTGTPARWFFRVGSEVDERRS